MIDLMKNKDKEAFKVPDGYFEDLTDNIMEKVKTRKIPKKTSLFTLVRPHLMMAASMTVFVIISYTLLKMVLPSVNNTETYSELAFIENYLGDELEEAELYNLLDKADTETGEADELSLEESDEIIDFLIDHKISYNEISTIY